jgi:aryl-alcohol dehydrogenase-like predicted oxidoreductase
VHPISAIQLEYSPFDLGIEDPKIGILAAARELGVTVFAYSPLGRGLLTGKVVSQVPRRPNTSRVANLFPIRKVPRTSRRAT